MYVKKVAESFSYIFEKRSDFLQKEWRETISGLFPEALDFSLHRDRCVDHRKKACQLFEYGRS